MSDDPTSGTPDLELMRLMRAPQERVYRAFLEPGAFAKWYGPRAMSSTLNQQAVEVGGTFEITMTSLAEGNTMSSQGEYLILDPHERIQYRESNEMAAEGGMVVQITFEPTMAGTRVTLRSWTIGPPMFPAEFALDGWQQAFDALQPFVEAGGFEMQMPGQE